ncbi:hypothetical protein NVP1121O_080 [Vibrio phage 1.121.O._10N.286.46.C4]|nr:hypothetical protein NVP1121O_080 [Vibrio phage 1.121.O._10N.286.46.C4]
MKLDSHTASVLLSCASTDTEVVTDLYKHFESQEEGIISDDAVKWFDKNRGYLVNIAGTNMVGRVVSLNTATHGFETGDRYPINVIIVEDPRKNNNAKGMTFPYALGQISRTKY